MYNHSISSIPASMPLVYFSISSLTPCLNPIKQLILMIYNFAGEGPTHPSLEREIMYAENSYGQILDKGTGTNIVLVYTGLLHFAPPLRSRKRNSKTKNIIFY